MSLIVINLFPSLDDDDDDEARERKKILCFYDQIMHETNHLSHEIYHFFLSHVCLYATNFRHIFHCHQFR